MHYGISEANNNSTSSLRNIGISGTTDAVIKGAVWNAKDTKYVNMINQSNNELNNIIHRYTSNNISGNIVNSTITTDIPTKAVLADRNTNSISIASVIAAIF